MCVAQTQLLKYFVYRVQNCTYKIQLCSSTEDSKSCKSCILNSLGYGCRCFSTNKEVKLWVVFFKALALIPCCAHCRTSNSMGKCGCWTLGSFSFPAIAVISLTQLESSAVLASKGPDQHLGMLYCLRTLCPGLLPVNEMISSQCFSAAWGTIARNELWVSACCLSDLLFSARLSPFSWCYLVWTFYASLFGL